MSILTLLLSLAIHQVTCQQFALPNWFLNRNKDANLSTSCTGRMSSQGSGFVQLPNDQAVIAVTIMTQGPNATVAQREAGKLSSQVNEAVLGTGYVVPQDIATTAFSLDTLRERRCRFYSNNTVTENKDPDLVYCEYVDVGSTVTNSLAITINQVNSTNINATSAVLDAIIYAAGKNVTIDSLTFQPSQAAQAQAVTRARELAAQDALNKLNPAASLYQASVGPITRLNPTDSVSNGDENGGNPPPQPNFEASSAVRFAAMAAPAPSSVPVSGGKTRVTASVDLEVAICG